MVEATEKQSDDNDGGRVHMDKDRSKEKSLWRDMPAIDVLKLADNEGIEYQKDLSLLFAGKSSDQTELNLMDL